MQLTSLLRGALRVDVLNGDCRDVCSGFGVGSAAKARGRALV